MVYRNTTLGVSLQDTLDEMIAAGQMSPELALKILLKFDKEMNHGLNCRINNQVQITGKVKTFRFCDNVWTFMLDDARVLDNNFRTRLSGVKMVAVEAPVEVDGTNNMV